MKPSLLIAEYGSEDEYDGDSSPPEREQLTAAKAPKLLPTLSEEIATAAPRDNPALHQGRRRSKPHVDGQFAAHVYVPVNLNKRLKLALQNVVDAAQTVVPEMHSLITEAMHISISRPIFLRAHQRDDFRNAVKYVVQKGTSFDSSFARLALFVNDEKTRAFLSLEVGAGHQELKTVTQALTPHLRSLRQEAYYQVPRFHISIAWALLSTQFQTNATTDQELDSDTSPSLAFPAIAEVPAGLVDDLETRFGSDIRAAGKFSVYQVDVKIGKVVSSFPLAS